MSTVQQPEAGQRFLMHNVSWQQYEMLLAEFGDRPLRMTYDRGNLEMMSPSRKHEQLARLLGRFVDVFTEELNIPIAGCRCTTFRKAELERGLEPDECFYIQNESRVRGSDEIDLTVDPPPDLAIEVDITHSSIDRMVIYAALGVPEFWRFDGETLSVFELGPDGHYRQVMQSTCFPQLSVDVMVQFLAKRETDDETTLMRSFRKWVRENVARDG